MISETPEVTCVVSHPYKYMSKLRSNRNISYVSVVIKISMFYNDPRGHISGAILLHKCCELGIVAACGRGWKSEGSPKQTVVTAALAWKEQDKARLLMS